MSFPDLASITLSERRAYDILGGFANTPTATMKDGVEVNRRQVMRIVADLSYRDAEPARRVRGRSAYPNVGLVGFDLLEAGLSISDTLVGFLLVDGALRAYAEASVWDSDTSRIRRFILRGVREAVSYLSLERDAAIHVADVLTRYPESALYLAETVLSQVEHWSSYLTTLDAVGRLPRNIYDACKFTILEDGHNATRTEYLQRQLRIGGNLLTAEQTELATVLAPTWEGTLNSLRATAQTIRPTEKTRALACPR
jgi:hypothetical protein